MFVKVIMKGHAQFLHISVEVKVDLNVEVCRRVLRKETLKWNLLQVVLDARV